MPDPARFELFAFWRSSAVYRVRVALNLKGLHADERYTDLDAGDQRAPAFLAVNPMGAIPALFDRELPGPAITQSIAILEYLDEIQPSPPLLPGDLAGRARVRSLAAMLYADTHPMVVPRMRRYLTTNVGFDDAAWRAWQTQWFTTGLQAVEQRLTSEPGAGAFCHGDSITLADICLASIVVVTRVFRIDVPDIPTVTRIMRTCEEHGAFARAAPSRQPGAPA